MEKESSYLPFSSDPKRMALFSLNLRARDPIENQNLVSGQPKKKTREGNVAILSTLPSHCSLMAISRIAVTLSLRSNILLF